MTNRLFADDLETLKELKPKNKKQWLLAVIVSAILLIFLLPLIKYFLITLVALALILPVYIFTKRRMT